MNTEPLTPTELTQVRQLLGEKFAPLGEASGQATIEGKGEMKPTGQQEPRPQTEVERLRAALEPLLTLAEAREAMLMKQSMETASTDQSIYSQQVSESWTAAIKQVHNALLSSPSESGPGSPPAPAPKDRD